METDRNPNPHIHLLVILHPGLKRPVFNRGQCRFIQDSMTTGLIHPEVSNPAVSINQDLKDYGTFIPGYRPGKRTADYLEKVMVRITYVGAGFLALVAIVPTVISSSLGVSFAVASFYGGTGLLIAVSVAFDLVQKIDSHLVMRNYRGLLEG